MPHRLVYPLVAAVALACTAWQTPQEQSPVPQPAQETPAKESAKGTPKIMLSADSWDFGTVVFGDMPSHVLTIKNEGDADLHLTNVRGSCSCTVPKLKTNLLKPGEATEVEIHFNTRKRQGSITQTVTIQSDDPKNSTLTFRVTGEVKKLVNVEPANVMLTGAKRDEAMSATVRITNDSGEPLSPEIKRISSEYIGASLKEIEKGKVYELIVTTKPPLPYGRTPAGIELTTGNPRQPDLQIPVNANIQARVSATPPVVFVPAQQTQGTARQVRIRYFGESPEFKVIGVESSNPDKVTVELMEAKAPQYMPRGPSSTWSPKLEQEVKVQVPPGSELGDGGVTITIKTNDPEFAEVTIPVTNDPAVFRKAFGLVGTTSGTVNPTPGAADKSGDKAGRSRR
jgi:hypothetical protein